MSDDNNEQIVPQTAVKPRKARARAPRAPQEEPESINRLMATDDQDDYELIRLHASDAIPPGGQPFGVNGRQFIMAAEHWYKVPAWLPTTIDNIIAEKPIRDEFDRMTGTRPMKVYPYEIWRG
jgi:hypothetical protein